ncbi:MAG: hypothetical protein ACYCYA_14425 [Actinomycetes bacterium]
MPPARGDGGPAGRAAYGELVSALLGLRADPATRRFDTELARALDEGFLDPGVARALRYWQRASLREVEAHLTEALPAVLAALDASATRRDEEHEQTVDAWRLSTGAARDPAAPAEDAWRDAARIGDAGSPGNGTPDDEVLDVREAPGPVSLHPTALHPTPPHPDRRRLIVAGLVPVTPNPR